MNTKICNKCNNELDISLFRISYKRPSIKTGELKLYYHSTCKDCESLSSTKRYHIKIKENPNMFKNDEYRSKLKKLRNRRFFYYKAMGFNKHYGSNFNHKEFALFLWHTYHHQKGTCAISGRKLTRTNIQIDHITPRTKDLIINDYSNLRLVTKEANKLKSNMLDADFKQLIIDVYNHFVINE